MLPEIIGKWYTRKPVADDEGLVLEPSVNRQESTDEEEEDDKSTPWCYCNEPSNGGMILCDNKGCTIKCMVPLYMLKNTASSKRKMVLF